MAQTGGRMEAQESCRSTGLHLETRGTHLKTWGAQGAFADTGGRGRIGNRWLSVASQTTIDHTGGCM